MARQNLISVEIVDATVAEAIVTVNNTRTEFPFLINLSAEERKNFRKMGPKSVDSVNENL